jgi:hypothetical protein
VVGVKVPLWTVVVAEPEAASLVVGAGVLSWAGVVVEPDAELVVGVKVPLWTIVSVNVGEVVVN